MKIIILENKKIEVKTLFLGLVFIISSLNIINFGNISLLTIVTFLFCLFGFIDKSKNIKNNKLFYLALSLLILSWSSYFWTLNKEITVSRIYAYTILPIYFMVAISIKFTKKDLFTIDNAIILSGWLFFIYSIATQGVKGIMSGRFALVEGMDQNAACAILFLMIIVLSKRIIHLKKNNSIYIHHLILTILLLWLYFMTGSRGGLLALAIFFLTVSLMGKNKQFLKKVILVVISLSVIYFILPIILPEDIYDRLFQIGSYQQTISSSKNRVAIWEYCFNNLIPNMGALGYGAGVPPYLIGGNFGLAVRAVHNSFLSMFLEFGLLGLTLFLSLLLTLINKALKMKNYIIFSTMLGIILIIFFLDAFPRTYFWNVLIYCGININSYSAEENK